jgi:hypothetical protein
MTESTPDFALLGALMNPQTSNAKALQALNMLQARVPKMDTKMKTKVLHAIKAANNVA